MPMIIPTGIIRTTGADLSDIFWKMHTLATQANSIAKEIDMCYRQGGVGNRASLEAKKIEAEAKAVLNRGKVLWRAVNIYENKEEELAAESNETVSTIEHGYNVSWANRAFVKPIFVNYEDNGIPVYPIAFGTWMILEKYQNNVNVEIPTKDVFFEDMVDDIAINKEAKIVADRMKKDEYTSKVDVPSIGQHTLDTCGSASGIMILQALGIKNITEEQFWNHANANGQGTYVYRIQQTLNDYIKEYGKERAGSYERSETSEWSTDEYYQTISESINAGYPVEVVINIPENDEYFNYKSGGHYVVITGIFKNDHGELIAQVNDPYSKQGIKNPQEVEIPLETLHSYNKRHSSFIIHYKRAE